MRNKILIVDANQRDWLALEEILAEIVQKGGELFFAKDQESALELFKKERPQIVFLDSPFLKEKEAWLLENTHVIPMYSKNELKEESEDFILKPFHAHQVLERCALILEDEWAPPALPM